MRRIFLSITLILAYMLGFSGAGFFGTGAGLIAYEQNGGGTVVTYSFGSNLGTCHSLVLKGAYIHTWKDASGNICGGDLWYRIYPKGSASGSFTQRGLSWSANHSFVTNASPNNVTSGNSGDQKWGDISGTLDLLSGLTRGTEYTIEFYFSADGNGSGTTGCGTRFFDNNNGANYSFDFTPVYTNVASGTSNCDGSWDDQDCWVGGSVPGNTTGVLLGADISIDSGYNAQIGNLIVPNGVTFTTNENFNAGNLNIESGATLTIASGKTLTITGDLDLTGTINLNGGNITFDDSATFSTASSSNYIIIDATNGGKVRKNFNATGAWTFHIGENDGTTEYSPIQVDFQTGTTFSSAYVEASVENTKHPNNSSTTDFINRYWTLTSSGISNMDCDITATYVDDDINGTEADIVCGKYSSGSWSAGSIDTANNQLLFNGATTFSDITGGEASALPVSLINFSAYLNPDNQARLSWSTASELNASHFNVHRSLDGVTKTKIGEVNAQGTSNTVVNYQFTDVEPIQQHTLYFLEQLDFDGATEWFGPVAVNMPFSDGITATFNKQTSNLEILFHRPPEVRNGQITILNAVGQQILDLEIALPNSQETALINLPALPSGVYFVNTQVGRRLYSTKLHY